MRFWFGLALVGLCALQGSEYHQVASTKQLMSGVQKPAMQDISGMLKAGGPKDDKEWERAQQDAAVLAEAAQLLQMGNRAVDQDGWVKNSEKLHESAMASMKAAESKDLEALKTSVAGMGGACKSCHSVYEKKQPR
jgi:cytochrome c556